MLTHSQIYTDAVENFLSIRGQGPLTPAEINFTIWASTNIKSYEQVGFEIHKARSGSRSIHPALDIVLRLEEANDEPLPFLI